MIASFLFAKVCSLFGALLARFASRQGVAGPCGRCESDDLDQRRMMIVARYGVDLAPRVRTGRCVEHRISLD